MTTILDLAQQHLARVKRSGNENIMAICPFHRKSDGTEERTPSFAMNVYSGLWYCHSCHARGNLFTFLRDLGYDRANIEFRFKGVIEEAEAHSPPKPDPMRPIQAATELLPESLLGLFDRGPIPKMEDFSEELLRKFDVGFDEKHNRITFPLRDRRGRLVGISGRAVGDEQPRYKVYDIEYEDFGLPIRHLEKRAVVWNFHSAYIELSFNPEAADRFIVITEGFKATMRVAEAGISSTVSLLSSYLADEQKWPLVNARCPLLLMFDNDDPGRKGQLDAGLRLITEIPYVFVVPYDTAQPSDLSTSAIHHAIFHAQPFNVWAAQYSSHHFSQ